MGERQDLPLPVGSYDAAIVLVGSPILEIWEPSVEPCSITASTTFASSIEVFTRRWRNTGKGKTRLTGFDTLSVQDHRIGHQGLSVVVGLGKTRSRGKHCSGTISFHGTGRPSL